MKRFKGLIKYIVPFLLCSSVCAGTIDLGDDFVSGTTIVSADMNTKLQTIETVINGNIDGNNISTTANITMGNAIINGTVDLGDASADTITPNGRFDGDLDPSADGTISLGSSSLGYTKIWTDDLDSDDSATLNDVTATGTTTLTDLVATTADINAGTFDGIVGGTTPADGSFTTLSSSGAATLATIDGIIGSVTPAAGTFTAITNSSQLIDQNTNNISLSIDAESTSADVLNIAATVLEDGIALDVNDANGLTTGAVARFASTSPSTSTRSLVIINNEHADADDTVNLYFTQAGADNVIEADSGARLTAAGAWTNAGASEVISDLDTSPYIDKLKNLKLYNFQKEKEKYGAPAEVNIKIVNGKKVKERKYNKNKIKNANAKIYKGFISEDPTTPEELISRSDDGDIGISPEDGVNFLLAVCKELVARIEVLEAQ